MTALTFRLYRCFSRGLSACSNEAIASPLRKRKPAKPKRDEKFNYFVDHKIVKVYGGNGGDGCISNLSVYMNEFAGPDGGNGGFGGHVIFKADEKTSSLNHVKTIIRGTAGEFGKSDNRHGKNARHRIINVPVGTIFRNSEREILAELDVKGSAFIAAKGGEGGKGNAYFKSSIRQTPEIAEIGGVGESYPFEIELKTFAHVGLIGFPNAGKSTLLRAVSRAAPKVAAYPFTTLNPHVGMVKFDDYESISIADIPGIIEGSHENKGLGIAFLRHIERCLCFLYVLDASEPDPWNTLNILKDELEHYKPGLSNRPHIVVANKLDVEGAQENCQALRSQLGDEILLELSAKHGFNLKKLLKNVKIMYDSHFSLRETSWD